MRRRLTRGPLVAAILLPCLLAVAGLFAWRSHAAQAVYRRLFRRGTLAQRLAQYGAPARARLAPHFDRAGLAYPPKRVLLVGIKDARTLELWAAGASQSLRFVREYPILGASGAAGPKLRRGDRQVPEGVYRVESLHPNSLYHLALRLDYPNAFDRAQAAADGRDDLGGDIMIHGKTGSVACLAMGEEAIEDLFVLAADAKVQNVTVVLAPLDMRTKGVPSPPAGAPGLDGELVWSDRRRAERNIPDGVVSCGAPRAVGEELSERT